jgi:hypothetical protein
MPKAGWGKAYCSMFEICFHEERVASNRDASRLEGSPGNEQFRTPSIARNGRKAIKASRQAAKAQSRDVGNRAFPASLALPFDPIKAMILPL